MISARVTRALARNSACVAAQGIVCDMDGGGCARAPGDSPAKRQAVKRHHHKHNIKHRYEFLQSLGNGTYGRVKRAVDRSGRMVRNIARLDIHQHTALILMISQEIKSNNRRFSIIDVIFIIIY